MPTRHVKVLVLCALTCALLAVPVAAGDPPKLSPDEVKKITAEWDELTQAGIKAIGSKQFEVSEQAFRKAVALAQRLNPVDFPNYFALLAQSWNNLGLCLRQQQRFAEAEEPYREALAARRKLYPAADFPDGHLQLILTTHVLGEVLRQTGKLAASERANRDGLDMARHFYRPRTPGDPKVHPKVAASAYDLSVVVSEQGRYTDSEALRREALAILGSEPPGSLLELRAQCLNGLGLDLRNQTRPTEAERVLRECLALAQKLSAPKGHSPLLVAALANLATALKDQEKLTEALKLYDEAKVMSALVYPTSEYPRGHPQRVMLLNNLGQALVSNDEHKKAEPMFREALEMCDGLYPVREYPDGHTTRAVARLSLAKVLRLLGRYKEAEQLLDEALAMQRRLYAGADYPRGHTLFASSLWDLGRVLSDAGRYDDADRVLREAATRFRRLYPASEFPTGHTDLAHVLDTLAKLQYRRNDPQARQTARESLAIYQSALTRVAADRGEGEALTLALGHGLVLDLILSTAAGTPAARETASSAVWAAKGAIARIYESRQLAARAATDLKAAKLLAELAAARHRRADWLMAPYPTDPGTRDQRETELKALDRTIENLNQQLSPLLRPGGRAPDRTTPAVLQSVLPADTAVVDFLKYVLISYNPAKPGKAGEQMTDQYLAFVLTGQKVTWIDLGPVAPISAAVSAWREAITTAKEIPDEVPAKVRSLVWEKVQRELPAPIKKVYVCPDADLCRVPWAALPGAKPGTILLEDYALATIPHAPFLLDHFPPPNKPQSLIGGVLAVSGVEYDETTVSAPAPLPRAEPLVKPGVLPQWKKLKDTVGEGEGVVATAKRKAFPTTRIEGAKATPAAVLAALPKAKYAHLATHGFFADSSFRSAFGLYEKDYAQSELGERVGRAANSPLVMTGLVFAGANNPKTSGRGIVTGEAIIDLNLSGLELAVLSACETGLGDVADGKGVFGLQRAFHYAGAKNVVVSLWKVPDVSTAALMQLFYSNLWDKNLSPMEALREAQLELYRNPAKIPELAKSFRGTFEVVPGAVETERKPTKDGKAHPIDWAAFTLSGPGR